MLTKKSVCWGGVLARKTLLVASHQKVQHTFVSEINHPTYTLIPLFVALCCYRMFT